MSYWDATGWVRIGLIDSIGRRSLWYRETMGDDPIVPLKIELRSGREGDDSHFELFSDAPGFRELWETLSRAPTLPADSQEGLGEDQ